MDISKTKDILIEAYEQLSSFSKSMNFLGINDDDFNFDFEWIEMCIGLCEVYERSDNEFVKMRSIKKLRLLMEQDEDEMQLSFNFDDKSNPVQSSIRISNDPNSTVDIAPIEFENVNF